MKNSVLELTLACGTEVKISVNNYVSEQEATMMNCDSEFTMAILVKNEKISFEQEWDEVDSNDLEFIYDYLCDDNLDENGYAREALEYGAAPIVFEKYNDILKIEMSVYGSYSYIAVDLWKANVEKLKEFLESLLK